MAKSEKVANEDPSRSDVDAPVSKEVETGISASLTKADSEETARANEDPTRSPFAAPESDEIKTSGAGQDCEEISDTAQGCEDDNTNHEQGVDLGGGWLRYWDATESDHYYFHFREYPTRPLPLIEWL